MKSKWIEHNGKKILYQDFSSLFYNAQAVKDELAAVQEVVLKEPENSVLVISNFKDTQIGADLMGTLNEASEKTKNRVRKTAVLGVTGFKRTLGDMLSRLTGQPLKYFENEEEAKNWLTED
ncbi:MAG: STAS/SEC14 domain-containing protein [Chloroflexi bacterium]|nr:STAS/SEC14 domain-containing protein [Chloroflexota bacterium]MBI3339755.1 STAS/SEC14 domain-containing protein [Chloroflexota bacterium]